MKDILKTVIPGFSVFDTSTDFYLEVKKSHLDSEPTWEWLNQMTPGEFAAAVAEQRRRREEEEEEEEEEDGEEVKTPDWQKPITSFLKVINLIPFILYSSISFVIIWSSQPSKCSEGPHCLLSARGR